MSIQQKILNPTTAAILALGLCGYGLILTIYRLYFSPLAKFPGPKLAAATSWYEFYFDVVKNGSYIWKIKELHEQYGPIVRVSPDELHVADPEFYEEIYTSSARKRDKDPRFTGSMGVVPGGEAAFWTAPHALHRIRREALNNYFSTAKIAGIQPLLETKIGQLCDRFEEYAKQGRVLNLNDGFNAFSMDVITEFLFGQSWKFLEASDFHGWYRNMVMDIVGAQHTRFHLPAVQRLMTWIPMETVAKVWPAAKFHIDRDKELEALVGQVLAHTDQYSISKRDYQTQDAPTVLHALRDSNILPAEEKNVERFKSETSVIVGAAGETTAKALSTVIFYLAQHPNHLQKVRAELSTLQPNPDESLPALRDVQRLPYLTACIKEALRISCGFCARSARSAPFEDLKYKQYTIPANTFVSTMSWFVNFNEDIFPNPTDFEPARWLGEEGKRRNRFFVPFGKGSRACQGQHLAWAELYLTLAAVVPKFDFDLFETTVDDVELRHDWVFAQPKVGSKGVRAHVRRRVK
ncbi:putative P450 monooxygenase [Myriangium duriaei CBS 260.36]|uniref:P450 monooxygenase n=1 Tax=Myriangium duriaei CBS 260.36 TaxID=1168546 RepID=A0A9P4ITX5_9PEZI|nr:putative P450 monooxygenase [Myriangium duriaei CBS 260.36]